jgi:hypothetical protein
MNRKFAGAALALSVLALGGQASAALLINGDFELGPSPELTVYEGIPTGWSQVAGQGAVDIISNDYEQGTGPDDPVYGVLLDAESGTHFLDMNDQGATGGIYQDVSGLNAGDALTLTLWTSQWVRNTGALANISYSIRDAASPATILASGVVNVYGTDWTLQTLTGAFVPASQSVRVQLVGFSNFEAGGGLDNVVLAATPTAAPEPASWALMILGVGGVGAAMRRRRPAGALAA